MSTVRHVRDNIRHDVMDVSESGNFVTKCGEMIMADDAKRSDELVDCPGCLNPTVDRPVVGPPSGRPVKQYRRPRNLHRETMESLQFSHKAVVASIEWMNRGDPGQFLHQALDQAKLAYRFLGEVLQTHNWLDDLQLDDT